MNEARLTGRPHSAASRINGSSSIGRLVDNDAGGFLRQQGSVKMSPGHGRRRGWRLALATAAAVAVTGVLPFAASTANAATATGDANPTACAHRVNNTPQKLVDCVRKDDLWAHMVKFQQIADANPGADGHPSRNSGEPGYKASADYVADVMRAAGYNVTLQEYKFDYFSFVGTPVMREDSPTPQSFGLGTEFNPGPVAGSATAKLCNPRAASSCRRRRPPARPAAARPPTSPGSPRATSP